VLRVGAAHVPPGSARAACRFLRAAALARVAQPGWESAAAEAVIDVARWSAAHGAGWIGVTSTWEASESRRKDEVAARQTRDGWEWQCAARTADMCGGAPPTCAEGRSNL